MNKTVKKSFKITGIVLGWLIATIAITLVVVSLTEPLMYGEYYGMARKEFPLPGINDGYVQQGLTYGGKFISSGYMSNGKPSRLYITDIASGKSTWISLKEENGKDHFGHAGGVAVYGDYVYLCHGDENANEILVFSLKAVLSAAAEGSVEAVGSFNVGVSPSFCYTDIDSVTSKAILYVGEFYREQNYSTSADHHLDTPAGDKHKAIIFAYELSLEGKNGLASGNAIPFKAYSITDLAQGMCITAGGKIVISTSYSIANSHHLVYDLSKASQRTYKDDNTAEIPLYYLDSAALTRDIVCPPMSEGLVYVSGRVYSIGEAASNKYLFGKILRATSVWSYELA